MENLFLKINFEKNKDLPSNIYHRLSSFSAATPSRINVESIPSVLKNKNVFYYFKIIFN
jgi:hypothetical protein